MRFQRILLFLIAFYLIFLGGAGYYDVLLPLRMFHHVFMTLVLAIWLLTKLRGEGLPRTPLNPAIYIAVFAWIVSAVFSIDRRMAFENIWFLILHTTIFFILVDLFQHGRGKWVMEAQFIVATAIIMISGYELMSWYLGSGNIGWPDVSIIPYQMPPRLAWAMNSPNWLAGYVAPLIILTGGWAYTMRKKDLRWTLWGLTGLLVLVLLFTFTRGGYMSFAAGMGAFTLLRLASAANVRSRLKTSFIVPLILVGLLGVAVVAFVFMESQNRGRSSGDRVRIDMYESAVDMLVDRPILGVGPGIFGRAYREYRTPELARDRLAAAHNVILGIASEGGLVALIVSAFIGAIFLRTWWQNWRNETNNWRRIRLESVMAALTGLAVHSMVDIFVRTPNLSLIMLLVAYGLVGHKSVLDKRRKGQRWPAAVGIFVLLVYAGWFMLRIDPAQKHYADSMNTELSFEERISAVKEANRLDPGLKLYPLQETYLIGESVLDNSGDLIVDDAISAYEHALELEPTWDTGWLNLAWFYWLDGKPDMAYEMADRAYQINPLGYRNWATAMFAEQVEALDDKTIIERYEKSINSLPYLPLSSLWGPGNDLSYIALQRYLAAKSNNVELTYRVLIAQGLKQDAYNLVSDFPQTAAEHWVAGEYALTVKHDSDDATQHFTSAIEADRANGDYYVSRARSQLTTNPDAARRDLDIAILLGTTDEYPYAVRAQFADDLDDREELLKRAVPGRPLSYAFSAVLYGGRASQFQPVPWLQFPGPGESVIQPWYDLLSLYQSQGRTEDIQLVEDAIADYAWNTWPESATIE